ncbi:hypothetical protein [Streptomyces sp. PsTaAH-124]|uniref:hypothetical protein n=1 Tax=Streptomyces sp. PsTaAH-124 TaxID=1157638 RepID=UPI00036FB057|nr:hypothetical protein [Streptomyces sp. PsTaAH-124]
MSGRAASETPAAISPAPTALLDDDPTGDDLAGDDGRPEGVTVARRARWTAAGAGALLTLAGCAAALLRLADASSARVPAAYAAGAAVCACAAVLGQRGRTRRALWLLVAGVMMMALGDQPG